MKGKRKRGVSSIKFLQNKMPSTPFHKANLRVCAFAALAHIYGVTISAAERELAKVPICVTLIVNAPDAPSAACSAAE